MGAWGAGVFENNSAGDWLGLAPLTNRYDGRDATYYGL